MMYALVESVFDCGSRARRSRSRWRSAALTVPLLVLALVAAACGGSDADVVVRSSSVLPASVMDSCVVQETAFDSWFAGGEPSVDAPVTAADSVGFPTDNNVCDFYTWGARMFLWLTSPEGDGLVLDGPSVFTVAPVDANGNRALIANTDGENYRLALRTTKTDDIGEVGQAGGGGVLMSQGESLVYYGVHVNDVYAYFLTAQKDKQLPNATTFPRNQNDLDAVMAYVDMAFPGVTIDNPGALSMELKTSWVEADTVPVADRSQFVTIDAEVPVYEPKSDTVWTATGETVEKTLLLTGMHVVGTVQNHPEFVWITYEHIDNAPFGDFFYTDSTESTVEQAFRATGDFQFMATNGTVAESNVECMTASDGVITGKGCGGIVPSDTYSSYPWGSAAGDSSADVVKNNTLLLSINNSIIGQLGGGDVRQNYIQTGGIWTSALNATSDAPIPKQGDFDASSFRGSLFAFNTTMETYAQGTSCFSCHKLPEDATDSFGAGDLSHIYSEITALEAPN